VAEYLGVCEQNKRLGRLSKRSPNAPAVGEFLPPPLGVGVTGPAPGDPGKVSDPRYALQWLMYERAKPYLTCVAPNREGKGLQPGASPGTARVPKKEVAINPINPRGELAMLARRRSKIEHISLNSHPFDGAFSGILRI